MLSALLSLFGYDEDLSSQLSLVEQQRLGTVAAGWLLSLLLLAVPAGYALWLIERSLLLALVTGAGTFVLTLNLLRVATAGGGLQAGSSAEQLRDYRPGLAPAVFVALLGLIFAQPAQLPLNAGWLEPLIEQHREELVQQHRGRVGDEQESRTPEAYRAELANCAFVVKRLALLWERPNAAARFSALYCLVILLPAFFGQFVALGAARRYQLLRYRRAMRFVGAETRALATRMNDVLSPYPAFQASLAARAQDAAPLLTPAAPLPGQLSLRRRRPR
jgi:hypothetical protein